MVKNKKIPWFLILIIFLAVVFLGTTIFLLYQNYQLKQKPQAPSWKTYTNNKYGYSIQYPPGWSVREEQHTFESQLLAGEKVMLTALLNEKGEPDIQIFFEGEFDHGIDPWQFEGEEAISLGGRTAEKITFGSGSEANPNKWILVEIPDFHRFRIEVQAPPADLPLIDQILSTFKFLE